MALLQYSKRKLEKKDDSERSNLVLPMEVKSSPNKELKNLNEVVTQMMESSSSRLGSKRKHHHYNKYSVAERAEIHAGTYGAENGAMKACRHLSTSTAKTIPEATAQRLKSEYLTALKLKIQESVEAEQSVVKPVVSVQPKKVSERPLLLEFRNILNH